MTSRDFCYWLQGYLELANEADEPKPLTPRQMQAIANHLGLVFKHEIDPSMGGPDHQEALNAIHELEKKIDSKVGEAIGTHVKNKPHSSGGDPFGPVMRC